MYKVTFDIKKTALHYKIIAKEKGFKNQNLDKLISDNAYNKTGYNKSGDSTITQRINTIIDDIQTEKNLDNIDIQFKYISWLKFYNENSGDENGKIIKNLNSYMDNYFSINYNEWQDLGTGDNSLPYFIIAIAAFIWFQLLWLFLCFVSLPRRYYSYIIIYYYCTIDWRTPPED